MRYAIYRAVRLVHSTHEGTLTEDVLRIHREALLRDPGFSATRRQLIDFRAVSAVELSRSFLEDFAQNDPWGGMAKRAIVATLPALFGISRQYSYRVQRDPALPLRLESTQELWRALDWLADSAADREALVRALGDPPDAASKGPAKGRRP